jgi:G3E family GTPase
VGKTTFANLLLDYYIRKGEKTAYIVNEFGQAGVDSALIAQKGFQTIDIVGGCICCTLQGKISESLRDVVANFSPSRIVFEPSGIFIFEKFLSVLEDTYLKENCEIDGVITIVDSTHVTEAMFVPGNFFANQVTHADTLILSKLQMYEGNAQALARRLRSLNERAGIWAKPWNELNDEDFDSLDFGGSVGISADDDHDGHEHDHHEHHHHDHEEDHEHEHRHIHQEPDTITIEPKDFDDEALNKIKELIKDGFFGTIYRIKGKMTLNGQPKLLQAVFEDLTFEDSPPDLEFGLTFIGTELDEAKIKEYWAK